MLLMTFPHPKTFPRCLLLPVSLELHLMLAMP
jgi:hypothetical protein